ncbi:two-component regulator propeller domain-containing protein [Gangjinia marincola]|uniref:Two-component regulator propeller domain-containing protein n=2 Tax=Gangjinia marincola TaxID=578463 RepID=A0ABP3XXF1_9FLAO
MYSQEVSIDRWQDLFSYYQIKDVTKGNGKIYAAAENAYFSYDIDSQEIKQFSAIDGLSGEDITTIYYSENYELLMLGYRNGLIEVVLDESGEIITDVGIVDKIGISPAEKKINSFFEKDNLIYIASEFGISEFNLEFLEFGDTYFIGENASNVRVQDVAIINDKIYAATIGDGIREADFSSGGLTDFENWSVANGGSWSNLEVFGEDLYASRTNRSVYRLESNNFQLIQFYDEQIRDFSTSENTLLVTTENIVFAYDSDFNLVTFFESNDEIQLELAASEIIGDQVFIGHDDLGIFQSNFSLSNEYESLNPNTPLLNNIFTIDTAPSQLWVGYGEYSASYNPFPLNNRGVSFFDGDEWINYSFNEILETPEIAEIAINPFNSNDVYLASFHKGVLNIVDGVPTVRYDSTNSPLTDQDPDGENDTRVNEIEFDSQGNLWILDNRSDDPLKILSPTGNFSEVNISSVVDDIAGVTGYSGLVIDRSNNVYFGTSEFGIVGYQPGSGNIAQFEIQSQDDSFLLNQVRAMALDQSGILWVGTRSGLRRVSSPASIFTESQPQSRPIIIEQDGVAQELLFEQTITDIEVDGANNKWISTVSSGVFYFSPNGQETIYHFTKENSPLPSNNVQEVAIDEVTGTVYIGTDKGLLAFKGDVTGPRENLENVFAYPNPVRPGFQGVVTIDGLTSAANVKITDVEGNLVFEQTTQGGSIQWDTTAFGKYKVASGVYLVLITAEDQTETTVSKIMIIR